ncbi:aldose 1-epimerase family protein [Burkholderia metallica]|uniref:aldose 1-epimerase family protein n=1 Tax=Burkholderia metallica TaxID=488729 RepID=UPI001CF1A93F|nr:aldose 1-epimerase family protein [Burkholderia metallica]MCA8001912.1 aldose 1-epimerase family protein [Burkholderia metallica]
MRGEIELRRDDFRDPPRTLYRTDGLTVTAFAYPSGVEALKIENRRGHIVVLPYLGQMIWAAAFDGRDLTMKHMFRQPKRAASIIDTYGCFMFHSGLLRNGCPGPDDTHALHGEMPCAPMDRASLVVGTDAHGAFVEVTGEYDYVQGFGSHYVARPSVRLAEHGAQMTIAMDVTNLGGTPMDLMYMAHLNYAYVPGGRFVQALPERGLRLRDSVPAHVKPTAAWRDYTATLAREPERLHTLDTPALYDPEIVFFMNDVATDANGIAHFRLTHPDGGAFHTAYRPEQFPHATRWILHNADQQVAAFALPSTCEPEGYEAERRKGHVAALAPGATRRFEVVTGYLNAAEARDA